MTSTDLDPDDVSLTTHPVEELVQDYEWFHTLFGIIGNVAFVVGSIFFLFESLKTAGVWLFIIGSSGMLVGSLGQIVVRRTRRRRRERGRA